MPAIDWGIVSPILIMTASALLVLVVDMFSRSTRAVMGMAVAGTLAVLVSSYSLLSGWQEPTSAFGGMMLVSRYSLFFNLVFGISTLLVLLISMRTLEEATRRQGEYTMLILLATVGMMLMASANDLIVVFLGLELMSLCLYVLAGFFPTKLASNEAGMKYLLLGAFASGFFLYGVALVYGNVGSTNIGIIASQIPQVSSAPLFLVGVLLLIVGFGFKVALVPFHQWAPDVYEGAPTPIAAFISAGPKAAGFAALFRVFVGALNGMSDQWVLIVAVLAALTMTVGNVVAVVQRNIKRMLAYSSVAHAGYVLVALTAVNQDGVSSAMFYLFVYCVMNIGAFGAVVLADNQEAETVRIRDYAGLGFRRPLLGLMMTFFMLALAGFPPTAGFIGKFGVFRSVLKANPALTWLVIVAVLNAVVSAYYYLRVVVYMYMREPSEELDFLPYAASPLVAVVLSVIGVLVFGVLPSLLMKQTALQLFM